MATVKFDLSDPETKATVSAWDPNTEYTVQTTDDPATGIAEVITEPEAEPAGTPEAGAPGPAAVKAAMGGQAA